MLNPYQDFFENRKEQDLDKWSNYFDIYNHYFSRYHEKKVRMLEIGVSKGGSMKMWKACLGQQAEIVGIDIDPNCKRYEDEKENIHIEIGSQDDPVFLQSIKEKYSHFDIILDDGGHTSNQQITSFSALFDHVADGGIYMVEDCCTSYWPAFGGGLHNPFSFIEFAKSLVDKVNSAFVLDSAFRDIWTECILSIHFHPGIVVFEKGMNVPPFSKLSGTPDPQRDTIHELINYSHKFITDASFARVFCWGLKSLFFFLLRNRKKSREYADMVRYRLKNCPK